MRLAMLYDSSLEIENLMNSSAVDADAADADLHAQLRQGNAEAFALIFARHHRFIYKFIYAMVGEQSLAEELTQETFLGAFKGIHSLRGEATLRTWLCGIAKNTVYKSMRSRRGQEVQSENEIESLSVVDEKNFAPDRQFLNKELKQLIQTALGKLDEDKRLIFTLKELQNLSYNEIAEITGHSIPKLKTDLHRAKVEMRNILRPYLEASER
jgi:RNA polymerase sigma-70 factor (ECF subfamily)